MIFSEFWELAPQEIVDDLETLFKNSQIRNIINNLHNLNIRLVVGLIRNEIIVILIIESQRIFGAMPLIFQDFQFFLGRFYKFN